MNSDTYGALVDEIIEKTNSDKIAWRTFSHKELTGRPLKYKDTLSVSLERGPNKWEDQFTLHVEIPFHTVHIKISQFSGDALWAAITNAIERSDRNSMSEIIEAIRSL